MIESWKSFETSLKLANQAQQAGKIARFKGLLNTLETCYYKFEEDFEFYKQDIIEKCGSLAAFNAVTTKDGVDIPAYPKNDAWAELQMLEYVKIRDLLEDSLLEQNNTSSSNSNSSEGNINLTVELYKSECASVTSSIANLTKEIEAYTDNLMPIHTVSSFEGIIAKLHVKISTEIKNIVNSKLALEDNATDTQYSHASIITKYGKFSIEQAAALNNCTILLTRKTAANAAILEPKVSTDISSVPPVVDSRPW